MKLLRIIRKLLAHLILTPYYLVVGFIIFLCVSFAWLVEIPIVWASQEISKRD